MPGRKRRKVVDTGRRTATTSVELIRQIADDQSIGRFTRRAPGVEAPRDVFMAIVDEVAAHFSGGGWRYARSRPHLSRREGDVAARLAFVSNRLNVAGELVGLWVDVHLDDRTLGAWRREIGNPLVTGSEVARRHLGHLLEPPAWLEWDLARPAVRPAAVRDIVETIEVAAIPWIETMRRLLDGWRSDPLSLEGYTTQPILVEYLIRAGRPEDAASVISGAVERLDERARWAFAHHLESLRRHGVSADSPSGSVAMLARAVARFELPIDPPHHS